MRLLRDQNRASFYGVLLCLSLTLTGCTSRLPAANSADQTQGAVASAAAPPLPAAFKQLTPLDSGFGVVVGDPVVATNAGPDAGDFGAGCTRWLYLELSNHQELGKTPDWTQIAPTMRYAGWSDWRLTPEKAPLLAHSMGVTHVVTSSIEGNSSAATLILQLMSVPDGKPVGDPVKVTGTYEAIDAALPTTAHTLLDRLGVKKSAVPADSSADVATLIGCGQAPIDTEAPLPVKLRRQLLDAALHSALAGILIWREPETYAPSDQQRAWFLPDALGARAFVVTKNAGLRISSTYDGPSPSYLSAFIEARHALAYYDGDAARRAGEQAVRSAPNNPEAWLLLGKAYSQQANAVRHGRFFGKMSGTEQDKVEPLYPRWEMAAAYATQLDPRNEEAWLELSTSAAFAGDETKATNAFWKAQSLAPQNTDVFEWGLELFQPKWTTDGRNLKKVVALTLANPKLRNSLAPDVMDAALNSNDTSGYLPAMDTIYRLVVLDPAGWFAKQPKTRASLATDWQKVRKNPRDKLAWNDFSTLMRDSAGQFNMSRRYFELCPAETRANKTLTQFRELAAQSELAIDPKNGEAWLEHAVVELYLRRWDEAIEAWKMAYSLAPKNVHVCRVGLDMFSPRWTNKPDELVKLSQKIADDPALFKVLAPQVVDTLMDLDKNSAQITKICDVGWHLIFKSIGSHDATLQKDIAMISFRHSPKPEVEKAYKTWIALAPRDSDAEAYYAGFLQNDNRTDEAVTHYRKALALNPDNGQALRYLAQIVMNKGDYVEAETLLKHATDVLPLWPETWFGVGEAESYLKHYDEARTNYEHVFALGRDSTMDGGCMPYAANRIQSIDKLLKPQQPTPAPTLTG